MNVRFEKKNKFEIYGIEKIFKNNASSKSVPKFWQECHKSGAYERLFRGASRWSDNRELCPINAVKGYRDTGKNTYPYMLCAKRDEFSDTSGYLIVSIPAADWAVFQGDLSDAPAANLAAVYKQAYGQWLPSSGYDVASDLNLELYYQNSDGKFYEEVWIPVKKL